jgi:hypothetical protein
MNSDDLRTRVTALSQWRPATNRRRTSRCCFSTNSSGDVSVSQLRRRPGGFSDEAYRLLNSQPGLAGDLVNRILDTNPRDKHKEVAHSDRALRARNSVGVTPLMLRKILLK